MMAQGWSVPNPRGGLSAPIKDEYSVISDTGRPYAGGSDGPTPLK